MPQIGGKPFELIVELHQAQFDGPLRLHTREPLLDEGCALEKAGIQRRFELFKSACAKADVACVGHRITGLLDQQLHHPDKAGPGKFVCIVGMFSLFVSSPPIAHLEFFEQIVCQGLLRGQLKQVL